MREHLTATLAAGVLAVVAVAPAPAAVTTHPATVTTHPATVTTHPATVTTHPATDREPPLVNEELVVAQVDASGLPTEATLYSRVVARDFPAGPVRDPSSTTEVEYLDRRGRPATDGQAVVVDVGGPGQTTVTTRATFDKPLPVALHAEYRQGPTVLAPDEVERTGGQMEVVYTVTNTTAAQKTIRYRDAAGRWTVTKQPVFAPFVGTLIATVPKDLSLIAAPRAVRSTTADGRTQLLWNLVLYPPMGDYQQSVHLLVSGDPLAVPGVDLQVMPVQSAQSPTLGFSTDLLKASVDGNAELADGLVRLDQSAVALAQGAADLGRGLRRLGTGTATLTSKVNGILVPGSRKLADGAEDLATAQHKTARGAHELAKGQEEAVNGARSAYDGAKSLQEGAELLTSGLLDLYDGLQRLLEPSALPTARDSADQLAQAVLRLRDVIGSPDDPAVKFPPTQASTLIQAVRASQKVAGLSYLGADQVHTDLKDIAAQLTQLAAASGQAAALAGSAQTQAAVVYQQACMDTATLSPAQCAMLQQAVADAGQAQQEAADVGAGVAQQAVRVGAEAVAVKAISVALRGIAAALVVLDTALTQISLALVSGTTDSPGVYEGLVALTDGLTATIEGLVKLSNGTADSAGGAQDMSTGTEDLTSGLRDLTKGIDDLADGTTKLARGSDRLADGSDALAQGSRAQADGTAAVGDALGQIDDGVDSAADGAEQLADGADQLQEQGTSQILAGVVAASKDPAFARAYLAASERRAADALPYGPPEGAAGRVAYVYTMAGTTLSSRTGTLAGWVLLAVIAGAVGVLLWRRVRPVAFQPGDFAFAPPPRGEPVALPPPGEHHDADWFFRPQGDQRH